MGHWAGKKYTFSLNIEDCSYKEIVHAMQQEINRKYEEEKKDPGESFYATMDIDNGTIEYTSSSYKSRVANDLSYELIKK